MGPIDYSLNVQSPFENALQGFKLGAGVKQVMDARAEAERQRQLQEQMNADLGSLFSQPRVSAQEYARLTVKYPQMREQLKQAWDMVGEDQRRSNLDMASQVYAALSTDRPDVAEDILRRRVEAMRNSGVPDDEVRQTEVWADMIRDDPDQARHLGGLVLASVMEPDKFASTYASLGGEERARDVAPADKAKAEAEARIKGVEAANAPEKAVLENLNVSSQIKERAARLALDQDKLQSDIEMKLYELGQKETKLDGSAVKIVNDSVTEAAASEQAAGQALQLAEQIERADLGSGAPASLNEWGKKVLGVEDSATMMRKEYLRLRNSQALKMLPPGPATDRDIEIAMKGFPAETADPKTLAGFLRGMAKMQQMDAAAATARAEWVSEVGSLSKARQDIEVDGVRVPAGTSFSDFARQYIARKAESIASQAKAQQVQGRSYMRHAQPQAAPDGTTGTTGDW